MIEASVEFSEFPEREHRDDFRIPAGLHAIGIIRKETLCRTVFHDGFR